LQYYNRENADPGRRFGANHFVMGVQFPGMPQQMVLDEMQMLAKEVFPKVRAGM
jgi:hypothetical protein|tara:strand:- start:536 stop:697 length:162 start_codon:yes stop_codon:yes gene_type:complete